VFDASAAIPDRGGRGPGGQSGSAGREDCYKLRAWEGERRRPATRSPSPLLGQSGRSWRVDVSKPLHFASTKGLSGGQRAIPLNLAREGRGGPERALLPPPGHARPPNRPHRGNQTEPGLCRYPRSGCGTASTSPRGSMRSASRGESDSSAARSRSASGSPSSRCWRGGTRGSRASRRAVPPADDGPGPRPGRCRVEPGRGPAGGRASRTLPAARPGPRERGRHAGRSLRPGKRAIPPAPTREGDRWSGLWPAAYWMSKGRASALSSGLTPVSMLLTNVIRSWT